jgi:hypothetical protein
MIVSQSGSMSTNPSRAPAWVARVDAPAFAFQIGRVTRRTRGMRGDVPEGVYGRRRS